MEECVKKNYFEAVMNRKPLFLEQGVC